MKIYVGHPSSIDYEKDLYQPLRKSSLLDDHELVMPHEDSTEPFNSKNFLRMECDLFIAEVSEASTGLGIEIGWANQFGVPVIGVWKKGSEISSSLEKVCDNLVMYREPGDLPGIILDLAERYG